MSIAREKVRKAGKKMTAQIKIDDLVREANKEERHTMEMVSVILLALCMACGCVVVGALVYLASLQ